MKILFEKKKLNQNIKILIIILWVNFRIHVWTEKQHNLLFMILLIYEMDNWLNDVNRELYV